MLFFNFALIFLNKQILIHLLIFGLCLAALGHNSPGDSEDSD